jgi:ABC transport system ATP-binding/permease protein
VPRESIIPAPESEKKNAGKMSFKLKHELEKLPEKILSLEQEIEALKHTLSSADLYMRDPEQFDLTSRRFVSAGRELEAAERRWLELEEIRANLSA